MISESQRFSFEEIDLSDATSVPSAGGTNTQTLQPDVGWIYEIVRIAYYCATPGGTSSGTHKLEAYYDSAQLIPSGVLQITGTHNTAIQTAWGYLIGDSAENPSSATDQFSLTTGKSKLIASNGTPIPFKYTNSTDVNQTTTRYLKIWVKKYPERI